MDSQFEPQMTPDKRTTLLKGWARAIQSTLGFEA